MNGRFVKDKKFTIDIIKDLAHRGLLFKKKNMNTATHICWRCKTPYILRRILEYITMSQLRDKMVHENETINWEPTYP